MDNYRVVEQSNKEVETVRALILIMIDRMVKVTLWPTKLRTRSPLKGLCIITTRVLNGQSQAEKKRKKKKRGGRNLI
jgi:hypothetical protein